MTFVINKQKKEKKRRRAEREKKRVNAYQKKGITQCREERARDAEHNAPSLHIGFRVHQHVQGLKYGWEGDENPSRTEREIDLPDAPPQDLQGILFPPIALCLLPGLLALEPPRSPAPPAA